MLPNAKIIHVNRNPVDTCLSCFTRLFNRNSKAAGPFQFIPRTATAMGLRDPYDEIASAEAAARLAADNAQALRRRGFEIDAPTLYLAHQQGATGAVRLLQGNQPAVDIVGRNAVVWNAGDENMTGPQFAGRILDYFRGTPQATPAPAPKPADPKPAGGGGAGAPSVPTSLIDFKGGAFSLGIPVPELRTDYTLREVKDYGVKQTTMVHLPVLKLAF